jgi:Arc/MetJ-type ribon-helix-helix transcriptional regulator
MEDEMAAVTVGFAIAEEDRAQLEDLVNFYAAGNRSEFLRMAMHRMARDRFANRLNEIQKMAHQELQGRVFSTEEIVNMVKTANADNS